MTPTELKYLIEETRPQCKFFTRENMKFSGDTMGNYGVRDCGDMWELFRRKPVKNGLQGSAFFAKGSLRQVWPLQLAEGV